VFAPFFTVFLWSILLYILIDPLYCKATAGLDRTKKSGTAGRTLLAGVFALGSVLIVFIPLAVVVSQLYIQGVALVKSMQEYLFQNPASLIYERISHFIADATHDSIVIDPSSIHTRVISLLESGARSAFSFSSTLVGNVALFVVQLALIVFCLFFFYLDAPYLSSLIKGVIPIKNRYTQTLVEKFKEIAKGLVLGYLTVAVIQATLAGIVFSLFHVQGALVFACLTFVCVFIPMLGGALVWVPVSVARIMSGDIAGGLALMAASGVCISLLDNFLRPYFLKDRLQLHPLIIFFAIMGGLALFGFNGLILGPLIIVLFLTVLEMFFKEHHIKKSKPPLEEDKIEASLANLRQGIGGVIKKIKREGKKKEEK
jgi:predicted PurR-regulated permease PerM